MSKITSTVQLLWRYTTGIAALRPSDVWLAAFPRSGSTWVRFLLSNLISLSELDGQEVDYDFVSATMPSIGRSNLLEPWPIETLPRVIKIHQSYRPILFAVPKKTVYILRDPRDVMVSYYHFRQNLRSHPYQGSLAAFVRHPRHGLRACIHHYLSWSPYMTCLVRYEELLKDTQSELRRILTDLQVAVPDDLVRRAVESSSFQEMRRIRQRIRVPLPERVGDPQLRGPQKGQARQWQECFSDADIALFEQICREFGFDLYT